MNTHKYLLLAFFLLSINLGTSQEHSQKSESIKKMKEIAFYTGYRWKKKTAKIADGSIYRNELIKYPKLGGLVSLNTTFDSQEENGGLLPFLYGVSGWDPVERKITFLDFSRDGMMVQGNIELVSTDTIQYSFDFAFPGNKRKLKGRDVLAFNKDKTEFVWTSLLITKTGELRKLNESVMIRGMPVSPDGS